MKRFYFVLFCLSVTATVLSTGILLFKGYTGLNCDIFIWGIFTISLIGAKLFWLKRLQKEPEKLSPVKFAGLMMLFTSDLLWTITLSAYAWGLL